MDLEPKFALRLDLGEDLRDFSTTFVSLEKTFYVKGAFKLFLHWVKPKPFQDIICRHIN